MRYKGNNKTIYTTIKYINENEVDQITPTKVARYNKDQLHKYLKETTSKIKEHLTKLKLWMNI